MDSELAEWERQLEKIVIAHLERIDPAEPLDHGADLSALGLTSLETVRLMVDIEEHFEIEIPAQDLTPSAFATFGRIRALIAQTLGTP